MTLTVVVPPEYVPNPYVSVCNSSSNDPPPRDVIRIAPWLCSAAPDSISTFAISIGTLIVAVAPAPANAPPVSNATSS